jgi:four helix bundle protein
MRVHEADRFAPYLQTLRFTGKAVRVCLHCRTPGEVSAHARTSWRGTFLSGLKAGTSAGANYEEANDGTGPRDALAKTLIVLRELKEVRWRLRVLRATGFLHPSHDSVIRESDELVRIVATIVRNKSAK